MTIVVRDDFSGSGNLNGANWADTATNFYLGQTAPHYLQQVGGFCTAAVTPSGSIPWRVSTFTPAPDVNAFARLVGMVSPRDPVTGNFTVGEIYKPASQYLYKELTYNIHGALISSVGPTNVPNVVGTSGFVEMTQVANSLAFAGFLGGSNSSMYYRNAIVGSPIANPIGPGGQNASIFGPSAIVNGVLYGIGGYVGTAFLGAIPAPAGVPGNVFSSHYVLPAGPALSAWEIGQSDDGFIYVGIDAGVNSELFKFDSSLTLIHHWTPGQCPVAFSPDEPFFVYNGLFVFNAPFGGGGNYGCYVYQMNNDFTFTHVGTINQKQSPCIYIGDGLLLGDDGVISLVPPTGTNGKGEALTVPVPSVADQYIEAGINSAPIGFDDNPPGKMLLGFRLTGGSGAIEGITVQFKPNADGTSANFILSETHSTVQTFFGAGAGGNNVSVGRTYTVRMEVLGTSLVLKVNGATIITATTAVSQVGEGYFYLGNDIVVGPAQSNNRIDYIEYGTFGGGSVVKTNLAGVSGGGSLSAFAQDATIVTPAPDPAILFTLDNIGAGTGEFLQRVDRTAFTVSTTVASPTFPTVLGGALSADGFVYTGVIHATNQLWKANGMTMTSAAIQPLAGNSYASPYPVFDNDGNVYITTMVHTDMHIFKVRCSDLSILQTLVLPNFTPSSTTSYDGRGLDANRGYLYVIGCPLGGYPTQLLKIALNTFMVASTITLTPQLLIGAVILIDTDFMYIGGMSEAGLATVQKWNLGSGALVGSVVTYTGQLTCGVLDAADGFAYFGGYAGFTSAVDLSTFTVPINTGHGTGPVRSVAVDENHVYAALSPDANGGSTWWLGRMTKRTLLSPTYLTDAAWTSGGLTEGPKTLMIL